MEGGSSSAFNFQTIFVTLAVIFFGASSWLSVNSVWVELPLFLNKGLPEGWNLPSYMSVVIQLACIGPIIYAIIEKALGKKLNVPYIIYFMLSLGCVATILLALFWDRTALIGTEKHSVALLALLFFLAVVDCTSSVLFLPYMFLFKHKYITVYFVGMGMSALIPSVFALVQGSGHVTCVFNETSASWTSIDVEPKFSVQHFNFIMFAFMLLAMISFGCLDLLPFVRRQHVVAAPQEENNSKLVSFRQLNDSGAAVNEETRRLSDGEEATIAKPPAINGGGAEDKPIVGVVLPRGSYILLLILSAWVCAFMNGILPSIQSFACLPYGQRTYHLTIILSNIANPVACFIPLFRELKSLKIMVALTALVSLVSGFILYQAAASPRPVLVGTLGGTILTIGLWICVTGLLAYLRTVLAGVLRASHRPRSLFWCGAATQFGSFLGALAMFLLVNVYQPPLFEAAPACGP